MGTYLAVGIIKEISIRKGDIDKKIEFSEIEKQLNQDIKLGCYLHTEDEKGYYWKIKEELFASNIKDFLEMQCKMYSTTKENLLEETLQKVLVERNEVTIIDYVEVEGTDGFEKDITVFYQMIPYFIDGKIIMECYRGMFKYLEACIRLQRNQYLIVDCVRVMITS